MRHPLKSYGLALVAAAALAACANMQQPRTTQDSIMYGYAGVAATYSTIASLAERGRITKAEGRRLIGSADATRVSLDAARASAGGDKGAALVILQAALPLIEPRNPEAAAALRAMLATVQGSGDPTTVLLQGSLAGLTAIEAILRAKEGK